MKVPFPKRLANIGNYKCCLYGKTIAQVLIINAICVVQVLTLYYIGFHYKSHFIICGNFGYGWVIFYIHEFYILFISIFKIFFFMVSALVIVINIIFIYKYLIMIKNFKIIKTIT